MEQPQEEFLERAQEIHPGSLSPATYEEILQMGAEFASITANHRIFLLGSYSGKKRDRLTEAEKVISNATQLDAMAFQMTDFLGDDEELNGILKYRLIADYADKIIMICEDSKGGSAIKQGMLAVLPDHLQKSHLCKREYPAEDLEHQRYSWMQSQGIFEIYADTNRLREWTDPDDLETAVNQILTEIEANEVSGQ